MSQCKRNIVDNAIVNVRKGNNKHWVWYDQRLNKVKFLCFKKWKLSGQPNPTMGPCHSPMHPCHKCAIRYVAVVGRGKEPVQRPASVGLFAQDWWPVGLVNRACRALERCSGMWGEWYGGREGGFSEPGKGRDEGSLDLEGRGYLLPPHPIPPSTSEICTKSEIYSWLFESVWANQLAQIQVDSWGSWGLT